MWAWILGAILFVVVVISYAQHRAQAGTYRTLASRQPARRVSAQKELGTEAIDHDAVNRVIRRNEALERGHTNWSRGLLKGGATTDTDIQPLADDETYAARFHSAFLKDKD